MQNQYGPNQLRPRPSTSAGLRSAMPQSPYGGGRSLPQPPGMLTTPPPLPGAAQSQGFAMKPQGSVGGPYQMPNAHPMGPPPAVSRVPPPPPSGIAGGGGTITHGMAPHTAAEADAGQSFYSGQGAWMQSRPDAPPPMPNTAAFKPPVSNAYAAPGQIGASDAFAQKIQDSYASQYSGDPQQAMANNVQMAPTPVSLSPNPNASPQEQALQAYRFHMLTSGPQTGTSASALSSAPPQNSAPATGTTGSGLGWGSSSYESGDTPQQEAARTASVAMSAAGAPASSDLPPGKTNDAVRGALSQLQEPTAQAAAQHAANIGGQAVDQATAKQKSDAQAAKDKEAADEKAIIDQILSNQAPQMDQGAIENMIRANQQDMARRQSLALRASMEGGAMAGIHPEESMGQQAEINQSGNIAQSQMASEARLKGAMENFQAKMTHYQQQAAALMQYAQMTHDTHSRDRAMAAAMAMQKEAESARMSAAQLQHEWDTTITGKDILGGVLGFGGTLGAGALGGWLGGR